jgi:fucose 4-O-acetylase-like acetyltransferase
MHTQTLDNPLQKKRVDYLDMLKCLGMFIVVSGHIHPDYKWFSLTVHCFVIPLYFLLSGMTFKRSKFPSLWEFIKHRAKTLLLPYLMFSLVTWAFWAVFNVVSHNQVNLWGPLLQTFIAQGSGGFLIHNVPLWFLPCLFVIEVLYYMIDKLPEWANITVCILLSVLGACMISWWRGPFILLPWSMESAFVSILFYGAGNWLVKHWGLVGIQERVLGKKWLSLVIMIVLTLVMINTAHWNRHITLGSDNLGKFPPMFYLNAFMGIVTSGIFAILVCSIKRDNRLFNAVMNYHLWYGRNSLYIMATHVPVKGIIILAIAKMIGKNEYFVTHDWWCLAIVFALTCAICSVLSLWIVKWKKMDEARVQKWISKKSN